METADRVDSARDNTYVYIDACEHTNKSYTRETETHTLHCDNCAWTEAAGPHSYNDEGICEACGAQVYTISFNSNGGSGTMDSVRVVAGETYTLPGCGFTAPSGKAFTGWDYASVENKPAGEVITTDRNLELRAHWEEMTWARLQTYINNAAPGTTITLDRDLIATNSDRELTIPEGANLTLDLNGHTLNRNLKNASSARDDGSVIHVRPARFVLKNGTLTGGYAKNGGGIRIDETFSYGSDGREFILLDVNITGNRASENGGGFYTTGYGSITGGTISDNQASENGGGIFAATGNQSLWIRQHGRRCRRRSLCGQGRQAEQFNGYRKYLQR